MQSLQFSLPIYYTQTFKTKPPRTFLVGMNQLLNAHYHLYNEVKHSYHNLAASSLQGHRLHEGQYQLRLTLYYKNPNCDPENIFSLIAKFTHDFLQEQHIIVNDNAKYHMGTTLINAGQDKANPRCEVEVIFL